MQGDKVKYIPKHVLLRSSGISKFLILGAGPKIFLLQESKLQESKRQTKKSTSIIKLASKKGL